MNGFQPSLTVNTASNSPDVCARSNRGRSVPCLEMRAMNAPCRCLPDARSSRLISSRSDTGIDPGYTACSSTRMTFSWRRRRVAMLVLPDLSARCIGDGWFYPGRPRFVLQATITRRSLHQNVKPSEQSFDSSAIACAHSRPPPALARDISLASDCFSRHSHANVQRDISPIAEQICSSFVIKVQSAVL
jgi:hypothetical protein